jgi:DNA-directed RNA polymerase subunit E'/Rpb7
MSQQRVHAVEVVQGEVTKVIGAGQVRPFQPLTGFIVAKVVSTGSISFLKENSALKLSGD